MTIPTAEWFGVVAWAAVASALATDRWWQCRKWHRGAVGDGQFIAWEDELPACAPEPAEGGHQTEKAAS